MFLYRISLFTCDLRDALELDDSVFCFFSSFLAVSFIFIYLPCVGASVKKIEPFSSTYIYRSALHLPEKTSVKTIINENINFIFFILSNLDNLLHHLSWPLKTAYSLPSFLSALPSPLITQSFSLFLPVSSVLC